jgi:CheY-like chemotaxis protein
VTGGDYGVLVRDFPILVRMSWDSKPPEAELARLLGLAERLAATGSDRAALAELQREIRTIQETAGSHGFHEASRLAAGMEATVRDWASHPDDTEVDRGSLTLWFVTRLAAMLKVEMPRRAAAPRPQPGASKPQRTAARPVPPAAPRSSPPPPPPTSPPPTPRRLIIRRPSAPQARPEPPSPAPATGPKRLRDLVADAPPPPPPPSPEPVATPVPPPPPPVAQVPELTWLIPPEPQPVEATASVEPPPAPEPPPVAPPPAPEPELVEATASVEPPPEPEPPPAPEPPPVAPPPAPEPEPVEAAAPETATVAEVIFVEDDASLAELLDYGLRSRGYRFLSYRNGREALRELLALDVQGTHPLLLLDVDLPGLDGYSIFDALQRERSGTYRVVFTTVHGTEEEQLRGLEAGALDYMVKPISLRVALERIKRWVGR